jgi:hypothetical protein
MTTHAQFLELFGILRDHLTRHALPELASVDVQHHIVDGMAVTVQLTGFEVATVAQDLVAWADTLTEVTGELWRPSGTSVHLYVHGRLPGGVPVKVFCGVRYLPDVFGADFAQGDRRTVALGVFREWAAFDGAGATA